MKKYFLFFFLQILLLSSYAQFTVSANNRYILKDGKPFFWMGDTGWELFHRLNKEQADYYLKRRAEQGFTVIQAHAVHQILPMQQPV